MAQPETFANDPVATLSVSLLVGDTTVTPNTYTNWPASGQFRLQCESEIMLVTDASTHPWPVTRGVENTTAAAHTSGLPLYLPLTGASLIQAILDRIVSRNLLVNGGQEYWQHGDGPFTTNGVYTSDRWRILPGTGSTVTVTKETVTVDVGSKTAAKLIHVISGANATWFDQVFKAGDQLDEVQGRTVSVSARISTATAAAVRVGIDPGTGVPTYSAYHSGGGAFETLTVTLAIPTGASYADMLVSLEKSCTAYVDNTALVIGPVPVDYSPFQTQAELARCQRYFEVIDGVEFSAYASGAVRTVWTVPLAQNKAASPTVTRNGAWAVTNCSQPAANSSGGFRAILVYADAIAAGQIDFFTNSADDTITVEANP